MNMQVQETIPTSPAAMSSAKASYYEALLNSDKELHSRVLNRASVIQSNMKDALECMFRAGAALAEQQGELSHSRELGFHAWLEAEGIGRGTAYNLINVFQNLRGYARRLDGVPPTVLYELAKPSTTPEMVESVLGEFARGEAVSAATVRDRRQSGASKGGHTIEDLQAMYLEDGWDSFEINPYGSARLRNKYVCKVYSGTQREKAFTFRGLDDAFRCRERMQARLQQLKPDESRVAPLRTAPVEDDKETEPVTESVAPATITVSATPVDGPVEDVEPTRAIRMAHDYYPTPERLLTGLFAEASGLNRIVTGNPKISLFEPCAGHGALAQQMERLCYGRKITSNEPYPVIAHFDTFRPTYQSDATKPEFWESCASMGLCDVSITNPPYEGDVMLEILKNMVEYSRVAAAALIRLGYLEPCQERAEWLRETSDCLRYWIPVNPRPQFRADTKGGDNVTVAWAVWIKDFSWAGKGLDCPFKFLTDWK